MHKDFYASGFLYHPESQQILLQQIIAISPQSPSWLLFEGAYEEADGPAEFFKRTMLSLLGFKVETVLPVYSYYNEKIKKDQSIVYSEVANREEFADKNGHSFNWFSFKDVLKLQVTEQTKHDIVVGQRVIEAAERKLLGIHTFQ